MFCIVKKSNSIEFVCCCWRVGHHSRTCRCRKNHLKPFLFLSSVLPSRNTQMGKWKDKTDGGTIGKWRKSMLPTIRAAILLIIYTSISANSYIHKQQHKARHRIACRLLMTNNKRKRKKVHEKRKEKNWIKYPVSCCLETSSTLMTLLSSASFPHEKQINFKHKISSPYSFYEIQFHTIIHMTHLLRCWMTFTILAATWHFVFFFGLTSGITSRRPRGTS